jgi:hypothetical protein
MKNYKILCLVVMTFIVFLLPYSFVSAGEQFEEVGLSNVFYIYTFEGSRDIYFESFSDDNDVWVYSLDNGDINLANEFTLSSMTPHLYVPENSYIKVVSKKPIRVYVFWSGLEDVGDGGTFYPSDSGSFVGNNFVIFPHTLHKRENPKKYLDIYSLETGVVEIKNETFMYKHPVNEGTRSRLYISRNSVYNITSTSEIMISHILVHYWFAVPSTTGQYVGKVHYAYAITEGGRSPGLYVIAYEPGSVNVTNLNNPNDKTQHIFEEAGDYWLEEDMFSRSTNIKIEGNIDTYVQVGSEWGWYGQSYVGGRVTEAEMIEYWVLINENWEGVIFAPEDVTFRLNDVEISLGADEYKRLLFKGGIYHIVSPKPLVVQEKPLGGYAVVPSGIPTTKPEIKEKPADNTMIYVNVAILVIAVVATLLYFLMKKS